METESDVLAAVPVAVPARRRRRVFTESEKRSAIERHASSGKSVVCFCRDEGIAQSSFWKWRRKFSGKPAFVEIPVPMLSAAVEVVLTSGDRIATSSDCDPLWLAKLIRSIGGPSC